MKYRAIITFTNPLETVEDKEVFICASLDAANKLVHLLVDDGKYHLHTAVIVTD